MRSGSKAIRTRQSNRRHGKIIRREVRMVYELNLIREALEVIAGLLAAGVIVALVRLFRLSHLFGGLFVRKSARSRRSRRSRRLYLGR